MKRQRRQLARHPLCLLCTVLVAIGAQAQDNDMIYCLQFDRDIGVGEVYYSGVFAGDYGWTLGYENDFYDYLESRGFQPDITEPFSPQPLRDFRISVPGSPYGVEVCVRDHECEDGDRVRVSINGIVLLDEEIVNAWSCRTLTLREGRHDIELFAVNGTGYKGENCNHADANTGEIQVTGEDSQTQTWRHRGRAGSSAAIEVTVR